MAFGPDGMWYLTPAEQRLSDAITKYEKACAKALFPDGYKRGYIMWAAGKTDKPMGWKCYAYVYDWQFLTIQAQYVGGP